jgi:hypothetical protein
LQALRLLLPAATTKVTPAAVAFAIAASSALLAPAPSDMFATAGLVCWPATQSTPAMTPALVPDPLHPSTRTATRFAFFATPQVAPPTVPATWVP